MFVKICRNTGICLYIHICIRAHIYIYICSHTYIRILICICIYIYPYDYMHILCGSIYPFTYIRIHIHIFAHVDLYIYIHAHLSLYIYWRKIKHPGCLPTSTLACTCIYVCMCIYMIPARGPQTACLRNHCSAIILPSLHLKCSKQRKPMLFAMCCWTWWRLIIRGSRYVCMFIYTHIYVYLHMYVMTRRSQIGLRQTYSCMHTYACTWIAVELGALTRQLRTLLRLYLPSDCWTSAAWLRTRNC